MRNIGRMGIIKDVPSYDLPPTALSNGNNIRFESPGVVRRAPGFRMVLEDTQASPEFLLAVRPDTGFDYIISADADGRLYRFEGAETEVTALGFVPGAAGPNQRFTGVFLDQCAYINRADNVPQALLSTASNFVPLTDYGWDPNWRAGVLRTWRDSLVAFDMTESGDRFPLKVRISDAVKGQALPPASWDEDDTTTIAFATTLPDAKGRLLDGMELKDTFILYAQNEAWRVTFIGGTLLYDVDKLFTNRGILATGCVAEAEDERGITRHYVWDENDIYVHDGVSAFSIADDRVREFIQATSNTQQARAKNFVFHSRLQKEVLFCYIGADDDAGFLGTVYPNRAAVYDLVTKTWSFRDLPSVAAMAEIVVTETSPWDEITAKWSELGAYWDAREQSAAPALICASRSDAPGLPEVNRYYGHDLIGRGSLLPAPLDPDATKPAFIERIGWDMDQVGEELVATKSISRLIPQAQIFNSETARLRFSVNGRQFSDGEASLTGQGPVEFDPRTQYKIDFRKGGRYLDYRVDIVEPVDFKFAGMDLEYVGRGRR